MGTEQTAGFERLPADQREAICNVEALHTIINDLFWRLATTNASPRTAHLAAHFPAHVMAGPTARALDALWGLPLDRGR